MKPTTEQIQAEVAALKAMKPNVRRHTAFGDDNRAAIEAQIRVLEDGLGDNDIYDRWDEEERLLDNALQASIWRDGDGKPPSEGWQPLVRK